MSTAMKMITRVLVCAAGLASLGLGSPEAGAQYTYMSVASGLSRPVFVTSAPGDYSRVFIVTKQGRIQVLNTTVVPHSLQSSATPFLNLTGLIPTLTGGNDDERGLLGLAFHPQFQSNGKFYVYYTALPVGGLPNGAAFYCNVVEYVVRDPGTLIVDPTLNQADPASARIIMQVPHPQTNHNGGWIGFGPDGYLYIASGDGGGANDTGTGHTANIGNGQDTGTPLGKMLRIDVNVMAAPPQGPFVAGSMASYGIPSNNPALPLPADSIYPVARNEIWAYGLRNHYRNSFDRLTGDLYIGDVGQGLWEEVNFQPALTMANLAQVAGRNYGWRCREGAAVFNNNGGRCNGLTFVDPTIRFGHGQFVTPGPGIIDNFSGCAIVGGYVYRGCAIPELAGKYIFGDYCGGWIIAATMTGGAMTSYAQITGPALAARLVSFGEDSYGELYFCDQTGGIVYKYVTNVPGRPKLGNCDHNRSGVVTVQDLFDYLAAWFAKTPNSDFNGNPQGTVGVTVQDLFDFLACWFSHCHN